MNGDIIYFSVQCYMEPLGSLCAYVGLINCNKFHARGYTYLTQRYSLEITRSDSRIIF